ncbi:MAG: SMP-30/gluconolactonase/LRE family protein, partial [Planctomycetota bacterium]
MGEVAFTTEPQAAVVGGRVTVTFAVSEPTDVEVTILDSDGAAVRHLAAGVIGGPNPPREPLQRGLRQTIQWDGRDDNGQPAQNGPFTARVRTGLTPQFDRFVGDSPHSQGSPVGLGTDKDGNLFVISRWSAPNGHYPGMEIKSFDREGNYIRQIMPYSGQLEEERRSGVQWIKTKDDDEVPLVYHGNNHSIYPQSGSTSRQSIVVRPDGKMVTTNAPMGDAPYGFGSANRRLIVLGSDSSVEDDYLGPLIVRREWGGGGYISLALSPDGETIYAAGHRRGGAPVPAVLRTTWDAEGEPEVFLGTPDEAGGEPAGLVEPRGLAVDNEGNLYVADNAAGRIAVFSPEGELVNQLAVDHPDTVAVHRETGAIYVLTIRPDPDRNRSQRWSQGHNWRAGKRVLKFKSIEAKAPAAALDLPDSPARTILCLDDSEEQAVLWLGQHSWGDSQVKRFVDRGDSFGPLEEAIRARVPGRAVGVGYIDIAVDPLNKELLVGKLAAKRYDARTGEYLGRVRFTDHRRMTRPQWGELAFAADGQTILHQTAMERLFRFDRDGNPVEWPAYPDNDRLPHEVIGDLPQGFMHSRGLDAAPDGGFYVLHHKNHRSWRDGRVSRVGPDGRVVQENIIETDVAVGGVRVDRSGNIYVGVHVKPAERLVPEWFGIFPYGHLLPARAPDTPAGWGTEPGQLPPEVAPWYVEQYGSLVKFRPDGGRVVFDENGDYFAPNIGGERGSWAPNWRSAPGVLKAEGVDWMWYG